MAATLKAAGFSNIKTGTWEAYSADSADLVSTMHKALEIAETSNLLDHYWSHIDKLSLRQATKVLAAAKLLIGKP